MGSFLSGSRSASARVADADASVLRYLQDIQAYFGEISAEQEEILARAKFIGGVNGGKEEDEGEQAQVVITPPVIRLQNEELIPQVEQGKRK